MDVRGLSRERASMIREFYWSNSGKNIDVETIRTATYCVVCQENKKYTAIGLVYDDEQKPLERFGLFIAKKQMEHYLCPGPDRRVIAPRAQFK